MLIKFYTGLVALTLTSACGGSSSSSAGLSGSGAVSSSATFASLASDGRALVDEYGDESFTEAENVPSSGTAIYNGVAAYSAFYNDIESIYADPDTVSAIQLGVNFGDGEVNGRAYRFRSADGGLVSGELDITNGRVIDNALTAEISGNLDNRGVDVTYTGSIQAGFVGDEAKAIVGTGTAVGTAPGFATQTVNAVFGAER